MSLVEIDREPPIRWVRLDSGKRNVLGPGAIEELKEALEPDEKAPVVVLSGRRDGFCSGLDDAVLLESAQAREEILAAMGELLLSAFAGATRIVTVCEGHAVAAGAMLLLTADRRIGTRGDYKIGFTEPRLGMPLPELPVVLARERLDRRLLNELTVLGRIVGPEEAVEAGFVDSVVAQEALRGETVRAAEELAALSSTAYEGTVRAVRGSAIARIEVLVANQRDKRDRARKTH